MCIILSKTCITITFAEPDLSFTFSHFPARPLVPDRRFIVSSKSYDVPSGRMEVPWIIMVAPSGENVRCDFDSTVPWAAAIKSIPVAAVPVQVTVRSLSVGYALPSQAKSYRSEERRVGKEGRS